MNKRTDGAVPCARPRGSLKSAGGGGEGAHAQGIALAVTRSVDASDGEWYAALVHRSRLAGFIIDCETSSLDAAASFWGAALGLPVVGPDGPTYVRLDASSRDLVVEVQQVEHPSRVHLDIESDDVDAEAARLEALGARRVAKIRTWWVMEAPTGQRFCIVRAKVDLANAPGAQTWT
jgi:hypothetical protein